MWKFTQLRKIISVAVLLVLIISFSVDWPSTTEKLHTFMNLPKIKINLFNTYSPYDIHIKDIHGNTILRKNVEDLWKTPLSFWNYTKEILMVIHVTKAGGQAFDKALLKAKHIDGCKMKCNHSIEHYTMETKRICPGKLDTFCQFHFDWSTIEEIEGKGLATAPVMLIRHPVSRFISHFNFFKTEKYQRHLKVTKQNFSQYLNDFDSMMESSGHWHDGQAIANWLAGTHLHFYPVRGMLSMEEVVKRDDLRLNWTYMIDESINNLHKCLWFGLLEDLDRGIQMLNYQTGLDLHVPYFHTTKGTTILPTNGQIERIKSLFPIDMYLYEYASQLFEHRWNMFQSQYKNVSHHRLIKKMGNKFLPSSETMSKLSRVIDGCKSTRHFLHCPSLGVFYNYTKFNYTKAYVKIKHVP